MTAIRIKAGQIDVTAKLNETDAGNIIADSLPLEGRAQVWGDEIYFQIPVSMKQYDDAIEEVDVGTIAYWPPGSALCLFFGATPASTGAKPRAASAVNVLGKIDGDPTVLRQVKAGTTILVEVDE